ncbi:MAG: hypothetical protein MUE81_07075 [Thermoflexibacter sp.]|jgi:hypothetical protein|nr:hypothetical protein [Thermoflexibacter sp.]
MRTSKFFTISLLSLFFLSITIFTVSAEDNPKKDTLKKSSTTKEEKKADAKVIFSQDEEKFMTEMDAYFMKKYSNPINVIQSKIEKVIVVNAEGKVIQEMEVTDHKEHEAKLPIGAEKLMVRGNTAYYFIMN